MQLGTRNGRAERDGRCMNKKIIFFLILSVLIINPALAWYDNSYKYVTTSNVTNSFRPYTILLNVSNSIGINNATYLFCNGHCNINFTDIIFTLDNTTLLPFWIENGTSGKVWINLTTNGTVNMYYGKSSSLSSINNGTNTFRFFDDFSGGLSKWNNNVGSAITSRGEVTLTGKSNIISKTAVPFPSIMVIKFKRMTDVVFLGSTDTPLSVNADSSIYTTDGYDLNPQAGSTYSESRAAGVFSSTGSIGAWNSDYIIIEAIWATNSMVWKKNDSVYNTKTNNIPSVSLYPFLAAYRDSPQSQLVADYIYIRSSVTSSPVWSSWSAESNNPTLLSLSCLPATLITTNSATLSCTLFLQNGSAKQWIQYSGYSNAYKFRTDYQTVTSDFSQTITGLPLQAGGTYYYNIMLLYNGMTYSSGESSFTLPTVSQITGYQFDKHTQELADNGLNISQTAITIPAAYTDIVGSILWGIVFGFIFVMIWLRQEDVTIPSILGLLIGASLWSLMPPDWVLFAYSLTIVSFAGLIYSLIKSKT